MSKTKEVNKAYKALEWMNKRFLENSGRVAYVTKQEENYIKTVLSSLYDSAGMAEKIKALESKLDPR